MQKSIHFSTSAVPGNWFERLPVQHAGSDFYHNPKAIARKYKIVYIFFLNDIQSLRWGAGARWGFWRMLLHYLDFASKWLFLGKAALDCVGALEKWALQLVAKHKRKNGKNKIWCW